MNSRLTIFAAWFGDDSAIGGLIDALERQGIQSIVIPVAEWPEDWTPDWVDRPSNVRFYVIVKWTDNARFITHRDCPLDEWLRDRKIILVPHKRWWQWLAGE